MKLSSIRKKAGGRWGSCSPGDPEQQALAGRLALEYGPLACRRGPRAGACRQGPQAGACTLEPLAWVQQAGACRQLGQG